MSLVRSARAASAVPAPSREFEFSFGPADFERVRSLIHRKAGINLQDGKQAMVYSRLSRRLRELGQGSVAEYLALLEQATGPGAQAEWQEFVNCLTTNLTSFFREEHHFTTLAAELLRRKGRALRIWCNAASTGEEPYSIAMTVIETLGAQAPVSIFCSDVDTRVLVTAESGVYLAHARGLSTERMHAHFLRGSGANSGSIQVKPELRRLVQFRPFNLTDAKWSLGEPFDIVFCRNVMIYFDVATQRSVLERLRAAMAPQSLLFAGHSENFSHSKDLFRLQGKTVHERL